jgi:hypothetical protein
MKLCILPISLGLTLVVGLGTTAWAQDKANFTSLQTTLKQQDDITLTTVSGDKVKGQMLDVSADRITVQRRSGPQTFEAAQIQKVQKRKNGVLLGGLIGLGASIPFVIVLSTYQYNEGGDQAAAFLPMAMGVGAGLGIDAAIGSNKTLYERKPSRTVTVAPLMDRKGGIGARVALKF